MCLKVATPLMVVLRLVDSDVKPAKGFIYEEMENATLITSRKGKNF